MLLSAHSNKPCLELVIIWIPGVSMPEFSSFRSSMFTRKRYYNSRSVPVSFIRQILSVRMVQYKTKNNSYSALAEIVICISSILQGARNVYTVNTYHACTVHGTQRLRNDYAWYCRWYVFNDPIIVVKSVRNIIRISASGDFECSRAIW